MKFLTIIFLAGMILIACQEQSSNSLGNDVSIVSKQDSMSYAIGFQMGLERSLVAEDINFDAMFMGMRDGFAREDGQLAREDVMRCIREFSTIARQRQLEEQQVAGKTNQEEGAEFLAKNAQRDDVISLPSGLQYRVIKNGNGPKPSAKDRVTVDYVGRLIDGTEFDSSHKRGMPATFGVSGVIRGWTEALQLMPVGSKWELFVPGELAYGRQAVPPHIKPFQTLLFEVELLSIEEPANRK